MAKVILDGKKYQATAINHISYKNKERGEDECVDWDIYGNCINTEPTYNYPTRSVNATIKGEISSTVTNVFIQGKNPIVASDKTKEADEYTLPSTAVGGALDAHSNVNGTMVGNGKNVYVNGKLLVVSGSNVTTHVGITASLNETGASSTVNIGV